VICADVWSTADCLEKSLFGAKIDSENPIGFRDITMSNGMHGQRVASFAEVNVGLLIRSVWPECRSAINQLPVH
jgi:hypothetical protein